MSKLHYNDILFLFRYSTEMAQKSCIVGLPVVPFNQNKVGDVVQYLQWLKDFLCKVFQDQVKFIYIFPFHSQYFNKGNSTTKESVLCAHLL